jgi:hypothetical protein
MLKSSARTHDKTSSTSFGLDKVVELTAIDYRVAIEDLFLTTLKTKLSTPISNKREIPSLQSRDMKIQALTEDARERISKGMRRIETIVGAKAFHSDRKGGRQYDFLSKVQQLEIQIAYYRNKANKLQESYEEFIKWLDSYYDKVLALEVQSRFEEKCARENVEFPTSYATFKVIGCSNKLIWTWDSDGNKTSNAPYPHSNTTFAKRQGQPRQSTLTVNKRLQQCLGGVIFHVQSSKWVSPSQHWQTGAISDCIAIIEKQNKKLIRNHGSACIWNKKSDVQTFLSVLGERCQRVTKEYEAGCDLPGLTSFYMDQDLRVWLEARYKEFAEFFTSYKHILREDREFAVKNSKISGPDSKIRKYTKTTVNDARISKKYLNGRVMYKKAPTMGQFWRTKILKSLTEPDTLSKCHRSSTRRGLKRRYDRYTGKYMDIYMAYEDFEGLKLPSQYERTDTRVPIMDFNGNPAKRQDGEFVMKWIIDLKSKYRGSWTRDIKNQSLQEISGTQSTQKSGHKRKRDHEDE